MPNSDISTADDALTLELEAMQTIARLLIRLRDTQTRDRVLRWTNERFSVAPAAVGAPLARAATGDVQPALAADPSLTVDARDFFPETLFELPGPSAAAASAAEPLDSLVQGFATDFRALALQWQRA